MHDWTANNKKQLLELQNMAILFLAIFLVLWKNWQMRVCKPRMPNGVFWKWSRIELRWTYYENVQINMFHGLAWSISMIPILSWKWQSTGTVGNSNKISWTTYMAVWRIEGYWKLRTGVCSAKFQRTWFGRRSCSEWQGCKRTYSMSHLCRSVRSYGSDMFYRREQMVATFEKNIHSLTECCSLWMWNRLLETKDNFLSSGEFTK